ncbi:TetR/AcrR family transcriptional regulator C-terminal domain-containing protein [Paenarthrobacter sp. PH39-S1]|uniref:TetR/AcrR family transcriptional regulator C-terminal domain-containing protein n=1 Tax=Paenarthrobacter sp. PH39-S1 TaxID=3046204 RepID=UPI0024B8F521|nr:TetR/AcrR family transcriptional regulator C-terminal domain-containing protein [Paenarthrobacter sp. PH39-S1]MDJ0357548.1 TetR/AcrR family transcriptional regulator C-terminal domain-containing protein [Paenarthrobacter sp. PH39-S1]
MSLSRQQIIDTALKILRDYGLADLSMRRLARDLGVQPGALYWHVKNKQELLGVLAERILENVDGGAAADDVAGDGGAAGPGASAGSIRRLALEIRRALLQVRDGAEVVSLAQALDPQALGPVITLRRLLATAGLGEPQAGWAARAVTHYILGAVAEEQTQADLVRAGLVTRDGGGDDDSSGASDGADDAFNFGVDLFLAGLSVQPASQS